jgi:hypothetical protein
MRVVRVQCYAATFTATDTPTLQLAAMLILR